jgi:hypothetical protein
VMYAHVATCERADGMTSVDIADVEAALGKVRAFIALLEENHAQWEAAGSGIVARDNSAASGEKITTAQIQEQLPLIKRDRRSRGCGSSFQDGTTPQCLRLVLQLHPRGFPATRGLAEFA